jgi:hypothetical protein
MTEWTKFQKSTMRENYIRLLAYIDAQMNTDEIDYAEREADTLKSYIEYYLEHLDIEYKYQLEGIIRTWILKEKILDVGYGFGDPTCGRMLKCLIQSNAIFTMKSIITRIYVNVTL